MIIRLRKIAAAVCFCTLVALTFSPSHACALSLDDVDGKSDEQLASENWESREVNANTGTMKCGFLAMLVSTVWRGYGHHCIGDDQSHYKLLAMEGASLGMLASSMLIGALSHDDKKLSGLWKTLFHYGTTLFIGSYLFDVIGTFKGDTFNFSENHLDPYGHSLNVQFRWLPSDSLNLGLQAGYTWRTPRFWLNPYAYLDVIGLSTYSFGADMGVALWYAEKTHTFVAFAVDTNFEDHLDDDYKILKVIPYIEFSLDLGSWFDHLAELRFINRFGVGVTLYDFEFAQTKTFSEHDTVFILESALSLNIIRDFNFMLVYRYRPDYSVGQISAPSLIFDTIPVPGVGLFSIDLSFKLSQHWTANIEANFGESVDFYFGAARQF